MRPAAIWTIWLTAAAMAVAVFGLFLVLWPTLALQGFSLLVYGDPGRLQALGGETARYISLAHAVLGAVMLGWGLMLVAVVQRLLAHGSKLGWPHNCNAKSCKTCVPCCNPPLNAWSASCAVKLQSRPWAHARSCRKTWPRSSNR